MTLEEHAEHTQKLFGLPAFDIHAWIDSFFEERKPRDPAQKTDEKEYNPYAHRKYRHCKEALPQAIVEFSPIYTARQITDIFECHLQDDYNGYLPLRSDFENPFFLSRFHSTPDYSSEAVLSGKEFEEYFQPQKSKHDFLNQLFAWRIIIPALAVILLFFLSLFIVIKPVLKTIMMDGKKQTLHALVSSGLSTLQYFNDLEKSGILTVEEAKKAAIDELFKIRFGDDNKDYYWIIDRQPVMIMHPYRPELIGQDVSSYRDKEDKSGINIFTEAVNVTEISGQGTISYLWQWKDDPDSIAPKLSFVRVFPPWDWIVGTGIYIRDVEIEIDRITNRLFLIFSAVALFAAIILLTIVVNSARIERMRINAEKGLKEAKDRYRALVLVSSEGQVLFMNGQLVFSNPEFCRLSGFDEKRLEQTDPAILFSDWESIQTKIANSSADIQFSSELLTSRGNKLPIHITATKVFFAKGDGLALSIYPKTENIADTLLRSQIRPEAPHHWPQIIEAIDTAEDTETVFAMHAEAVFFIKIALIKNFPSSTMRTLISELWYALVKSFVRISLKETGPAPCGFVFLALGSNARREMTLFSDQDNALIWDSGLEHQPWFLGLGTKIVSLLERAGFLPCPGGIVASNPDWCIPSDLLTLKISEWMGSGKSIDLMRISTLFDGAPVSGEIQIAQNVQKCLFDTLSKTPAFLGLWASHVVGFRLPKEALSSVLRIKSGEVKTKSLLAVKECLKVLETFARLLAGQNSISVLGSLDRIAKLTDIGLLTGITATEYQFLFEELWELRFWGQLKNWDNLDIPDEMVDLSPLSDTRLRQIRTVLEGLEPFIAHINARFFGGTI